MNLKLLPISLALLAVMFAALTFVPISAQALPWSISILPQGNEDIIINAGDLVIISVTGPDGATIYVELLSSNDTAEVMFRFPTTGFELMSSGILVITWSIPPTIQPLGLYYAQVKTEEGSVRAIIGFQIKPYDGQVVTPPTMEERLDEVELRAIRLEFENERMQEKIDDLIDLMNADKQSDFILTSAAVIMGLMAIVAAFAGRSKILRQIFWNEKEEDMDETIRMLLDLLRFWVLREFPAEVGGIVLKVDVERERAKAEADVAEQIKKKAKKATEEMAAGEESLGTVEQSRMGERADLAEERRKERKTVEKTCEYCGEAFKAKSSLAKYCPGPCKLKAFREKRKKEEGEEDGARDDE
jgi:hypothetical protein